MVTVEELHVYPVKSARGIARRSVRVTATGFEWDRHWMVIDAEGRFLTQRTHPKLACIETELSRAELTLRTADAAPLRLPLEAQGEPVPVEIWKERCEALDQGDAAGSWASEALGEPVRLVRVPATPNRAANPRYAGPGPVPVAFSDGFPILVCNRASLDDLNERLPEPIPMNRFRPNLVLEGLPPYAEDRIAAVRIGAVTLRLVKPCTRCVIPSTDQRTGERTTNPLPALRRYRFDKALRGVTFGENAVPDGEIGASIELGEECVVTYDA